MSELATVDKSAVSVVSMLEHAKEWLATAVETTGPAEIAAAKAQIATAETYARELNLSKDIQQDAQEMVRRAEYALGRAIRKGQAEGTIARREDNLRNVEVPNANFDKTRPSELLPHKQVMHEVYEMAQTSVAEFDAALGAAKAEGNLSRANVVRKVKGQQGPTTRDQRADLILDLANKGYSSRQMPARVGVTEESVRQIARDYDIDIPADKSIARTRRVNSTSLVENTATALEGLVMGIELIDYQDVDPAVASQWADSLTESMRVLNRFVRQLKEKAQ